MTLNVEKIKKKNDEFENMSSREIIFVISNMNIVSNEIEMFDDFLNEVKNSSINTLSKSFFSCMKMKWTTIVSNVFITFLKRDLFIDQFSNHERNSISNEIERVRSMSKSLKNARKCRRQIFSMKNLMKCFIKMKY